MRTASRGAVVHAASTEVSRSRSNARYRDGQELYLKEAQPRTEADVIVDNTDLAHPHRVFADYC